MSANAKLFNSKSHSKSINKSKNKSKSQSQANPVSKQKLNNRTIVKVYLPSHCCDPCRSQHHFW